MEQTLEIVNIIRIVFIIVIVATIFWEVKSKGAMLCKVTQLVVAAVIFALQIPLVVFTIFLNRAYGLEVFYLCMAVVYLIINSFLIGKKMKKREYPIGIGIIIGPIPEKSVETSDN